VTGYLSSKVFVIAVEFSAGCIRFFFASMLEFPKRQAVEIEEISAADAA
jgi:hypothetical protein